MIEITVTASESGQKVLKYLLRKTDGTKVFLFKCFRKGDVRINGKKCGQDAVLAEGDVVTCRVLGEAVRQEKFANISIRPDILFIDADIVAVDKPAGVLVHAAGGAAYSDTLTEQVKAELHRRNEPYDYLTPLHRLDKNTRGVLLFARNYEATRKISQAFHDGLVEKLYLARLEGHFYGTLFVEADIVRKEEGGVRVNSLKRFPDPPEKSTWLREVYSRSAAVSGTEIKAIKKEKDSTLCEIVLWTGRHHQIRAVCGALKFPIAGDLRYGGHRKENGDWGQELICRSVKLPGYPEPFESRFRPG
jgi:23S rRNA pseudouridine955/2504/2580 synthase